MFSRAGSFTKKVADKGFIAILSRQLLCCRTHERWFPSRHHSDEVGLLEAEDGCGVADMQVVADMRGVSVGGPTAQNNDKI